MRGILVRVDATFAHGAAVRVEVVCAAQSGVALKCAERIDLALVAKRAEEQLHAENGKNAEARKVEQSHVYEPGQRREQGSHEYAQSLDRLDGAQGLEKPQRADRRYIVDSQEQRNIRHDHDEKVELVERVPKVRRRPAIVKPARNDSDDSLGAEYAREHPLGCEDQVLVAVPVVHGDKYTVGQNGHKNKRIKEPVPAQAYACLANCRLAAKKENTPVSQVFLEAFAREVFDPRRHVAHPPVVIHVVPILCHHPGVLLLGHARLNLGPPCRLLFPRRSTSGARFLADGQGLCALELWNWVFEFCNRRAF